MGVHSLMFVQPFTYFYDITQHMAKRKSNTGIPGLSFSWKRGLGITQAKQKFARETGIPTSKTGLERKIGKMILKSLFGK